MLDSHIKDSRAALIGLLLEVVVLEEERPGVDRTCPGTDRLLTLVGPLNSARARHCPRVLPYLSSRLSHPVSKGDPLFLKQALTKIKPARELKMDPSTGSRNQSAL
jgi:hypothetical protein